MPTELSVRVTDDVELRRPRAPSPGECLRPETTRLEIIRAPLSEIHRPRPAAITCGTNLCASNNSPRTAANRVCGRAWRESSMTSTIVATEVVSLFALMVREICATVTSGNFFILAINRTPSLNFLITFLRAVCILARKVWSCSARESCAFSCRRISKACW